MKYNSTLPSKVHNVGRQSLTLAVTGAFRRFVPEFSSFEHPHFVLHWRITYKSHTLAEVLNQACSVSGETTCSFLTTLLVLSELLRPQLLVSLFSYFMACWRIVWKIQSILVVQPPWWASFICFMK